MVTCMVVVVVLARVLRQEVCHPRRRRVSHHQSARIIANDGVVDDLCHLRPLVALARSSLLSVCVCGVGSHEHATW